MDVNKNCLLTNYSTDDYCWSQSTWSFVGPARQHHMWRSRELFSSETSKGRARWREAGRDGARQWFSPTYQHSPGRLIWWRTTISEHTGPLQRLQVLTVRKWDWSSASYFSSRVAPSFVAALLEDTPSTRWRTRTGTPYMVMLFSQFLLQMLLINCALEYIFPRKLAPYVLWYTHTFLMRICFIERPLN